MLVLYANGQLIDRTGYLAKTGKPVDSPPFPMPLESGPVYQWFSRKNALESIYHWWSVRVEAFDIMVVEVAAAGCRFYTETFGTDITLPSPGHYQLPARQSFWDRKVNDRFLRDMIAIRNLTRVMTVTTGGRFAVSSEGVLCTNPNSDRKVIGLRSLELRERLKKTWSPESVGISSFGTPCF